MPDPTRQAVKFLWDLPVRGDPYAVPDPEVLAALAPVSSATACAALHKMGVRRTFITGPVPLIPGQRIIGRALTLQFMPQREDIASGIEQEYIERNTALWKVLEATRPGDVLVVQAFGSVRTGCLGEMLIRYFRNQGGAGIVVDGRTRDTPKVRSLGVPIWSMGATPHYASQDELFPWGYEVPVACGGVLVLPGDIIIADDDGAVVVPTHLAPELAQRAGEHEGWEAFSRQRIDGGGALSRYYPLDRDAQKEFQIWQKRHSQSDSVAAPTVNDEGERRDS